jgi:hypothetical protein
MSERPKEHDWKSCVGSKSFTVGSNPTLSAIKNPYYSTRSKLMEKAFEFFDAWLRSQKDFLDNWLRSQNELMENWLDSIKRLQMSIGTLAGTQPGTRQVFDLFNSWFTMMLNSTKTFTEGITNLQNSWKTMIENQMEMSKEIATQFLQLFKRVEEKKTK